MDSANWEFLRADLDCSWFGCSWRADGGLGESPERGKEECSEQSEYQWIGEKSYLS